MSNFFYDRFGKAHEIPEREIIQWRPSVYGVAVVNDKVLMLKDGGSTAPWEFPGGGLEKNEDVLDALKREYQEETGYKVRPVDTAPIYVGCRNFYSKGYGKYFRSLLMLYRVELIGEAREALAVSGDDLGEENITAVEWIPLSDFIEASVHTMWHPALKVIFEEVIKVTKMDKKA